MKFTEKIKNRKFRRLHYLSKYYGDLGLTGRLYRNTHSSYRNISND